MEFLKSGRHAPSALFVLTLLAIGFQATRAESKTLVLLCKGTQYCATCADNQKRVDFDWTYTVDFSANTVDGRPAKISDQRITWQLNSSTLLDEREISRYSKKFHFAGRPVSGGGEIYYGDGICTPQTQKAF